MPKDILGEKMKGRREGGINKNKPCKPLLHALPVSGLERCISLFLLHEEYSYFPLFVLPPARNQFYISRILEFYLSKSHLSSIHKAGSS